MTDTRRPSLNPTRAAAIIALGLACLLGTSGCNDDKMPEIGNVRIHHDIQNTSKQIDEDLARDLDLD
jgi:hypothetical protein